MLDWQVIFFDNAPTWQYGNLIRRLDTPYGSVPTLMCTTVNPVLNGFVELVIAAEKSPELRMLVRAENILCARYMKEPNSLGFAALSPKAQTHPTNHEVPPSSPPGVGGTTGMA